MHEYVIGRDNDSDLKFTGECLASANSCASADSQRWTQLNLYRTAGGALIAETIGYTMHSNEHTRRSAVVCEDTDAVVRVFGYGWLAKQLYERARIDATQRID